MRSNLPMTQSAYAISDRKGCIAHCNPRFVNGSGFSSAEFRRGPST